MSRLGNHILEIPYGRGVFQSLRIDINGNSVNGEATIRGLEVVPVSPPAIADKLALDASTILESTDEVTEIQVNPGERM